MYDSIDTAIQAILDDLDFEIDGYTAYDYEYEPKSAVLQYFEVLQQATPLVISSEEDSVTFSIEVSGLVAFEAAFTFSVRFGAENMPFGSSVQSVERKMDIPVVITVVREINPELEVLNVDVTRPRRIRVDFGSIDPDGGYEE